MDLVTTGEVNIATCLHPTILVEPNTESDLPNKIATSRTTRMIVEGGIIIKGVSENNILQKY
jgi:hypothetical protein